MKNIKEVHIKAVEREKFSGLYDADLEPADIVYQVDFADNPREHRYDLHAMQCMFDLTFGELFPSRAQGEDPNASYMIKRSWEVVSAQLNNAKP